MKRPALLSTLALAAGVAGAVLVPSVTGPSAAPVSGVVAEAQVAPRPVDLTDYTVAGRTVGAQLAAQVAAQRTAAAAHRALLAQQARQAQLARLAAARKARAERAARATRSRRLVSYGSPREIARAQLAARGWSSQYGCLDSLWTRESGWRTTAANPSGAYGIPQALPGSKMASAGADWRTNPATQIRWGLSYIASTYGSPCAAWSHSQSNGWY
jgi:hypothetical protein